MRDARKNEKPDLKPIHLVHSYSVNSYDDLVPSKCSAASDSLRTRLQKTRQIGAAMNRTGQPAGADEVSEMCGCC